MSAKQNGKFPTKKQSTETDSRRNTKSEKTITNKEIKFVI